MGPKRKECKSQREQLKGDGQGGGTTTDGDQVGTGITEKNGGTEQIEVVKRKIRGLVRIGFEEKSQDVLEGWIDAAQRAIIVNTGHPAQSSLFTQTIQAFLKLLVGLKFNPIISVLSRLLAISTNDL